MSDIGALVDQTYREWLRLADEQPVAAPLDAAVDASTTTFTADLTTLDTEDRDAFQEGILLEAELELVYVTSVSVSESVATLTVRRGMAGTTAAAHDDDTLVYPSPEFPRHSVFNAVCDNIVTLYPSLFRTATEEVATTTDYTEVPAAVITPIAFHYSQNSRHRQATPVLLDPFPASSTGKAVQFFGVSSGTTGQLVYRGRFTRPSLEATTLASLGVETEWGRIVAVGAAAQLVAGRELDSTVQRYVSEMLRMEGMPVGSHSDIRNSLLQLQAVWMDQARRVQVSVSPPLVQTSPTLGAEVAW